MSYIKQVFAFGEAVSAAKMNQTEDNAADHQHGNDSVTALGIPAMGGIPSLYTTNTSGSETTKLDVSFNYCTILGSGAVINVQSQSLSLDTTLSGVGGFDIGSAGQDEWAAVYTIGNDSGGSINTIVSSDFNNPIMPAGWTHRRFLHPIFTNSAQEIEHILVAGNSVQHRRKAYLTTFASTTPTLASPDVPLVAYAIYMHSFMDFATPNTANEFRIRPTSGSANFIAAAADRDKSSDVLATLNNSQQHIVHRVTAASASNITLYSFGFTFRQ